MSFDSKVRKVDGAGELADLSEVDAVQSEIEAVNQVRAV